MPQYQTRNGYQDSGEEIAKETVLYAALVAQVELLMGGELTHSSSRLLEKRGWGLLLERKPGEEEAIAALLDQLPSTARTWLGDSLESVSQLTHGRTVAMS